MLLKVKLVNCLDTRLNQIEPVSPDIIVLKYGQVNGNCQSRLMVTVADSGGRLMVSVNVYGTCQVLMVTTGFQETQFLTCREQSFIKVIQIYRTK
jgi:hypothetical protein